MKKIILVLFMLLAPSLSFAAGPSKVAKADRSLWPNDINTCEGFDEATIHEAAVFASVFEKNIKNLTNEEKIKEFTGLKNVNKESVDKTITKIKERLLSNVNVARKRSHDSICNPNIIKKHYAPYYDENWEKLITYIDHYRYEKYEKWLENAESFYENYTYELIRLAALFPNITSEIDVFDNSEINGHSLPDKMFILTFDDGPSAKGGSTDNLINTLRKNDKEAIFFVLGDNFVKRDDIKDLYKGFVIGSHGKEHKPHTKAEFYKQSLTFTKQKIDDIFPNQQHCYFRPPYGQRTPDTVAFLADKKCQVMLWNIDSQDWSSKMSSKEVKDRVITLMLLWRSGIVLFHDIHNKAAEVLPEIWKEFENSGIIFTDKAN